MSTIEIAQNSFPWEAAATVLTGFLAVGAAFYVGLKQTAVDYRQAEISSRQLALAETNLREKLFDRRMAIYEAVNEYISEAGRTGAPPVSSFSNFYTAVIRSKFLLSKSLAARLEALLEADRNWRVNRLALNRRDMSEEQRMQINQKDNGSDVIFAFAGEMRDAFAEDLDLTIV